MGFCNLSKLIELYIKFIHFIPCKFDKYLVTRNVGLWEINTNNKFLIKGMMKYLYNVLRQYIITFWYIWKVPALYGVHKEQYVQGATPRGYSIVLCSHHDLKGNFHNVQSPFIYLYIYLFLMN